VSTVLNQFLSGGVMFACWVAGLFFLRFWRRTHDRLFGLFALAFWLLALERVMLLALDPVWADETRAYVYSIRSLAYLVILAAILEKNRGGPAVAGQPPEDVGERTARAAAGAGGPARSRGEE
jgi:hypothetical protein